MSTHNKKNLVTATVLLGSFFVVLAVIFMPVFPGKMNGLDYLDNLFNMISKGSSYFIPKVIDDSEKYAGTMIKVSMEAGDEQRAGEIAQMLTAGGVEVAVTGSTLLIEGDMGMILKSGLADAEVMFGNQGQSVAEKYGFSERQVMVNWWKTFSAIGKDLTKQKSFDEAKIFANANKKALEPAYNYYGVDAKHYKENIGLIIAALGFYVLYTMWYGFGLLYLFEGLGLRVGH